MCSYLNRWTSPDTIIPDPNNPLDWDRYSYTRNNPVKYIDPTGHRPCSEIGCPGDSYDSTALAESIRSDPTCQRYWDGLTKEERQVLSDAGWDQGSFNDHMGGGNATPADMWHDPLTYILIIVGGIGTAKAVLPWFLLPTANNPTSQTPDLSAIVKDIEEWVGQGEKPIAFLNKAGDIILRNVENTRRFQAHFNNYYPHKGPHFHLDILNEVGEWITKRIFPLVK